MIPPHLLPPGFAPNMIPLPLLPPGHQHSHYHHHGHTSGPPATADKPKGPTQPSLGKTYSLHRRLLYKADGTTMEWCKTGNAFKLVENGLAAPNRSMSTSGAVRSEYHPLK